MPTEKTSASPAKRPSAVRTGRLGLRTTPAQAALIQRAAEVARKSVTEFILASVCEKAEQILLDQRLFIVDELTWQTFQNAIDRPPRVNAGLRKLISEPALWEK